MEVVDKAKERAMFDLQNKLNEVWQRYQKGGDIKTLDRAYRRECEQAESKNKGTKAEFKIDYDAFIKATDMKPREKREPKDFEIR